MQRCNNAAPNLNVFIGDKLLKKYLSNLSADFVALLPAHPIHCASSPGFFFVCAFFQILQQHFANCLGSERANARLNKIAICAWVFFENSSQKKGFEQSLWKWLALKDLGYK